VAQPVGDEFHIMGIGDRGLILLVVSGDSMTAMTWFARMESPILLMLRM
jgi:hypothetical protein